MRPKVIINLPDCKIKKYQDQQRECYETWIPEVRKIGIEVIKSVSEETLDSEYKLDGDSLLCKCNDNLDENFVLKRYYFLKWALENRDFDYVFVTSFDTYVWPDRFYKLLKEYWKDPRIEFAGAVWPYLGWDPKNNFQIFLDSKDFEEDIIISGGSGYILSRRATKIICEEYPNFKDHKEKSYSDDAIFSKILRKNSLRLFHDNRIMYSSPYLIYWEDPNRLGVPLIGEENFLAVQSNLNGKMRKIHKKIYDSINNNP